MALGQQALGECEIGRFIVYGAGGIGGTIGARLLQAGAEVVLLARGEHLRKMRAEGLRFVAPEGEYRLHVPVASDPEQVDWRTGDTVLLCVKSQQTEAALAALAAALLDRGLRIPVICAQNGVANERHALRWFPDVYGMVVNLPALHLEPGVVVTHAQGKGGILDLGRYPNGVDETAETVAAWLQRAGFSARPEPAVMRWKYAKLLMNLGNALQAAVTAADAAEPDRTAQRQILRALRQEALACYTAAGIDCAGREEVRMRQQGAYTMVDIPGWPRSGGSSWQSIHRGTGDVETNYLNGEIVMLGALHGVATPANRACQILAWKMLKERLPVGAFSLEEVLIRIENESVVADAGYH